MPDITACSRCQRGDHTNHNAAFGGICIGCSCPVVTVGCSADCESCNPTPSIPDPHVHGPSQPLGWDEDCLVCNPELATNDHTTATGRPCFCDGSEHHNPPAKQGDA